MRRNKSRNQEVFHAAAAWEWPVLQPSNGSSLLQAAELDSPSCSELLRALFPWKLELKLNWSGWCSCQGSRTLLLDDITDQVLVQVLAYLMVLRRSKGRLVTFDCPPLQPRT